MKALFKIVNIFFYNRQVILLKKLQFRYKLYFMKPNPKLFYTNNSSRLNKLKIRANLDGLIQKNLFEIKKFLNFQFIIILFRF